MFYMRSCARTLCILVSVSVVPALAKAEPTGSAKRAPVDLRALLHNPAFSDICPLVVYGEDYADVAAQRTLSPDGRHLDAAATDRALTRVLRKAPDVVEFSVTDGLNDYVDAFMK